MKKWGIANRNEKKLLREIKVKAIN